MTRKRSRPFTVKDVEYVYKNYADMTASEIAEELGISKFQVAKIVSELRKHGVDLPKKVMARPNPVEEFLKKSGIPTKKTEASKRRAARKK